MTLYIHLDVATAESSLPALNDFRMWVSCALQADNSLSTASEIELTIRLVDEPESAALNYKYRHKSNATNILSFAGDVLPESSSIYLGDLVICAPLVYQEAAAQQKDVFAHWAHLTIHGVLHLLGYDHEEDQDAITMEGIEIKLLASLGLGNPYQDATH